MEDGGGGGGLLERGGVGGVWGRKFTQISRQIVK
jgi:hypothetical protein